jgi:hypothetical protein
MVCKFPLPRVKTSVSANVIKCLLELRLLDHLQRICGTNGYSDPGATTSQLFRRESMRYRTIKTTLSARNGRRGRDVKSDDYVSRNFAKCNVKHNGHMSREEYANCHE